MNITNEREVITMINMLIEELMLAKLWPIYTLLAITALYFIVWGIIEK